jgi:hypothetical protein
MISIRTLLQLASEDVRTQGLEEPGLNYKESLLSTKKKKKKNPIIFDSLLLVEFI